MRALPILVLLAAVALAGCTETPSDPEALAAPGSTLRIDPSNPEAGTIEGFVTDDELRPLEDVTVTLVERDARVRTDATGAFRFEAVPAGAWTLRAEADFHASRETSVAVRDSVVQHVELKLAALPALVPHSTTIPFVGHFDCAAEYLIITGDCWLGPGAVTGLGDPAFTAQYVYPLPIQERWESVVMELVWGEPANNQLDGMRLYLENGNGTEDGHSYKVGRVNGPESPIAFTIHRGEPHPRADTYPESGSPAAIADEGELAQVRVFPMGRAYDVTSQVCSPDSGCFLGVGLGLDIRFDAYATVFYNERAPAGYSGIPDGR